MLFIQGTRDAFAQMDLLEQVLATLPTATLHTIQDADHGFAVPKRANRPPSDLQNEIATTISSFVTRTSRPR
jgi:predicted alpha/beta-hydrolase family hydrolase